MKFAQSHFCDDSLTTKCSEIKQMVRATNVKYYFQLMKLKGKKYKLY